jgi:hypothetical protein
VTTKRKLKLEGERLKNCLCRQSYPPQIYNIAADIIAGINAAQLAARVHPAIKAKIVDGVTELEKMLGAA